VKEPSPADQLRLAAAKTQREATALAVLLETRPVPVHLGERFAYNVKAAGEILLEVRAAIVHAHDNSGKVRW
jgi:hypothetical protein